MERLKCLECELPAGKTSRYCREHYLERKRIRRRQLMACPEYRAKKNAQWRKQNSIWRQDPQYREFCKKKALKQYHERMQDSEYRKKHNTYWRTYLRKQRQDPIARQKQREAYAISSLKNQCRKLGITVEYYKSLPRVCALCGTTYPGKKGWHKDHDHVTGKFRGLLCGRHNTGLGLFHESIEELQQAIQYLEKHQGEQSELRHIPHASENKENYSIGFLP